MGESELDVGRWVVLLTSAVYLATLRCGSVYLRCVMWRFTGARLAYIISQVGPVPTHRN